MTSPDWMPVFTVKRGHNEYRASHADAAASDEPAKRQTSGKWHRIGTAFASRDGSYTIKLASLPLSGTLVMRPAREGETIDLARTE